MTCHGRTVTARNPPATLASSSVASLVASPSRPAPGSRRIVMPSPAAPGSGTAAGGSQRVTVPAGRTGTGLPRRQNAVDPGFHGVPAGILARATLARLGSDYGVRDAPRNPGRAARPLGHPGGRRTDPGRA